MCADSIKPGLPLASVLILSYNSSETLAETIESVLNQKTDYSFEILIGDDFSTDGSRDICRKYFELHPDKIKLLFHEKNLGLVRNWLTLVEHAKGRYITVCAGDDYWHNPDKLKLQVDYLEARPDYGLVYSDYDLLNSANGKRITNYLRSTGKTCPEGAKLIKQIYEGKVPIMAATVCFRMELFRQHIPVADYVRLKFPIEDWPTWLILSKYCKFGYLPVSTVTYRKGHESISNPLQYEKMEKRFEAEHVMYKYVSELFPEDINYSEANYQNYANSVLLNLAFKKSDFSSAKKYAGRLLANNFQNQKVKIAGNWFLFKTYTSLQKIKGLLHSN